MTPGRTPRILAIDPGTREMGVALDGGKLVYHGVKVLPKRRTPHATLGRAGAVVIRLLADFRPDTLAVEKAFIGRNRNASLLNVLAVEIQAIGRRKGLRVIALAPGTVRKAVCGNGWAAKEDMAKTVAQRFPELKAYLGQNRRWKVTRLSQLEGGRKRKCLRIKPGSAKVCSHFPTLLSP
jgi:Holliday junction resolvasome RuvABC endonuclease subunit